MCHECLVGNADAARKKRGTGQRGSLAHAWGCDWTHRITLACPHLSPPPRDKEGLALSPRFLPPVGPPTHLQGGPSCDQTGSLAF